MIRFHTLGPLELRAADGRTHHSILAQPKRTAMLAYLAVAAPRGYQRRDTLLGLFWPESETERARHSLNQALYALRSALGAGVLVSRGNEEVGVAPEALWCDAAACDAALEAGELEQALELYRGDLLPGFFLSAAPEFGRWLESERLRVRARVVEAAWRLAEREAAAGNTAGAAHSARRAAALVPDDELTLRRLIGLLDRLGDRAGALSAYDAFVRRLAEEYGAEPAAETRRLIEAMHAAVPVVSPSPPPAPQLAAAGPLLRRLPAAERHPLPVPPTPFLGRAAELAAVGALLRGRGCRLLTLLGPGGIGKTRLALQVGSELCDGFADGVRFVALASADSPELLPSTLARALDLSLAGERNPVEQILESLAAREMLLILDNFDHLVESAGFLAQLLEQAARVKLLVTSREALNVRGETLYSLPGLDFPAEPQAADLEHYPAVQLFLQTAKRAQPELTLTAEDRTWLARICARVEGLPLAIELAAVWLRVVSCEELYREIQRSFAFLTAPFRDLPERHRSLHAAFTSSWRHLTEEEKTALRRLAVFRGGFRREAAAAVAGASEAMLLALADKSLLRRLLSGRFEMLEVLRHFAEERLEPERAAIRDRHSAYYARFLAEREAALADSRRDESLAEVAEEIANLRAAWRWAAETRRQEDLAGALESLFVFYDIRGWHQEAAEAFALAVHGLEERNGGKSEEAARTLSRLLARQGVFWLRLGSYQQARALLARSLGISRQLADQEEIAFTLDRLGVVLYNLGCYTEARQSQEESLAIRRGLGNTAGVATSLNNLGSLAYAMGEYTQARRLCVESLNLQRQLEDRGGVVLSLQNLAYISLLLGDEHEAMRLLREALVTARESGSGVLLARALHNLGNLANARGESMEARSYFEQALAAALESGTPSVALDALLGLSVLLSRVGEKEWAYELLASALRHPAGEWASRRTAEQLLVDLKAEIAPDAAAAALGRARTRTLEELLETLRTAAPSRSP
jgi:predicted ATPase/DNA-binding SARP family transcriptional activator